MASHLDVLGTAFQEFKVIVGHPEPEEEQRFVSGIDEELEGLDPVCLAYSDHLGDRRVLRQFYGAEVIVGLVVESEEACTQKIVLGFEVTIDERLGAPCYLCEVLGGETLFPALGVGFDRRV